MLNAQALVLRQTTRRRAVALAGVGILALTVLPVRAQTAVSILPQVPGISKAIQSQKKPGWIEGVLRGEMKRGGFAWGSPAHIRIYKEENLLEMWMQKNGRYEKFKNFRICQWSGKLGPKLQEGDRQAPEGVYTVTRGQLRSRTKNHRAISINFPNVYDRRVNRTGSYLQIHGGCGSAGCFAITDRGIEEIYRILDASFKNGQKRVSIHTFPFRLTDEKMQVRKDHEAFPFWSMLKPIYASFNKTQTLPGVRVCGTRYVAPGGKARPPEKCVPAWQTPKSTLKTVAKQVPSVQRTAKPKQVPPPPPPIAVKCNLHLPSCKRWLANTRRALARRGISTRGVRLAGASYVHKGRSAAARIGRRTRVVRNTARDRRRRALRQ